MTRPVPTCSYCDRPSLLAVTVRTSTPVDPYAPPKLPPGPSRIDVVRYCGVEHQPPSTA